MARKGKLSDCCLIDHFGLPPEAVENMKPEPFRIVTPLRFALAKIDRKIAIILNRPRRRRTRFIWEI